MFVAERDVETHIWKTVYYQVKYQYSFKYIKHTIVEGDRITENLVFGQ